MEKLNPEKSSQRLQNMNRHLDFIPMGKSTEKENNQIVMAYGKALPYDEIRSIMGRAIPPELIMSLLALGKEPWKFKDSNDQFASYHQQWQSDQQNQIMLKMTGKLPGKSTDDKRKNDDRKNHNSGGSRSGECQVNNGCRCCR
jgi:hypothetical protein